MSTYFRWEFWTSILGRYKVTSKGIINSFGEVVVPMALIEAAGIKNDLGYWESGKAT